MPHSRQTVTYTERIKVAYGNIHRIVTAKYKDEKELEVLKQRYGSEDIYLKNVEFNRLGGWLFISPNDKRPYTSEKYGIDKEWYKCCINCSLTGEKVAYSYKELEQAFLEVGKKEFVYTLRAFDYTKQPLPYLINEVYMAWKKCNRVELLIKLGYTNIAIDKRIATLPVETEKKLLATIKKYKPTTSASLNDLFCMMKNDCEYKYVAFGGDKKLPKYLLDQSERYDYYKDYLKLAKKCGKNLKDNYWKYPKNLVETHNQLMRQVEEEEKLKEQKRFEELDKKIKDIYSKKLNLTLFFGYYTVALPCSLDDIKNQAQVLSQCLITNNYHTQHANKEITLVFIKRKGKPIATAEIKKSGVLGQFYADEKDREKCTPSRKVKGMLNAWLETYNKYLKGE